MEVILIYLMGAKLNNSKSSHMDYYKLLFFQLKCEFLKFLELKLKFYGFTSLWDYFYKFNRYYFSGFNRN